MASEFMATGGRAILAKLQKDRRGYEHGVCFAYGSETGTALEITRCLRAAAVANGFTTDILSLDGLASRLQQREMHQGGQAPHPPVIVVTSSTGDGEPPSNARGFWSWITTPRRSLAGLRYTILGLGDSNFTRYQNVPRMVRQKLELSGAVPFHPCSEADEVSGLEEVVDAWSEGLWDAIRSSHECL